MENGVTADGTVMAVLHSPMVTPTTESIGLINVMVAGVISGAMDVFMMGCSARIVATAEELLLGLTGLCMKENSAQDSVKAKGPTSLVTVVGTKEAGRMDGTMAMAFASGKMVDVTKESGLTGWLTARELKPSPTALFGTMVNGSKMNLACNLSLS